MTILLHVLMCRALEQRHENGSNDISSIRSFGKLHRSGPTCYRIAVLREVKRTVAASHEFRHVTVTVPHVKSLRSARSVALDYGLPVVSLHVEGGKTMSMPGTVAFLASMGLICKLLKASHHVPVHLGKRYLPAGVLLGKRSNTVRHFQKYCVVTESSRVDLNSRASHVGALSRSTEKNLCPEV